MDTKLNLKERFDTLVTDLVLVSLLLAWIGAKIGINPSPTRVPILESHRPMEPSLKYITILIYMLLPTVGIHVLASQSPAMFKNEGGAVQWEWFADSGVGIVGMVSAS